MFIYNITIDSNVCVGIDQPSGYIALTLTDEELSGIYDQYRLFIGVKVRNAPTGDISVGLNPSIVPVFTRKRVPDYWTGTVYNKTFNNAPENELIVGFEYDFTDISPPFGLPLVCRIQGVFKNTDSEKRWAGLYVSTYQGAPFEPLGSVITPDIAPNGTGGNVGYAFPRWLKGQFHIWGWVESNLVNLQSLTWEFMFASPRYYNQIMNQALWWPVACLPHDRSTVVFDKEAMKARAREASTNIGIVFGPYAREYPSGAPVKLYIRAKTTSNTNSADIIRYYVYEQWERYVVIDERIKGTDFTEANKYQMFKFDGILPAFAGSGLELTVGFRGSSPVVLDAYVQSGGERTVAIMAFLLALQQYLKSPIRAVDEFDVHMDPVNRETMMRMLLSHIEANKDVQFIVITPSQISVLSEKVNIIFVQNVQGRSEVIKAVSTAAQRV